MFINIHTIRGKKNTVVVVVDAGAAAASAVFCFNSLSSIFDQQKQLKVKCL